MLIEETTATGQLIRDYITGTGYMPVAQIDSSELQETISYLYADHLQTPRLATGQHQSIVWRWDSDGFGTAQASGKTTINIIYPGQYHDQETGLHYNHHRYYGAHLSRYITSDSTGLEGGINTYLYADANSIIYIDSTGKVPVAIIPVIAGVARLARLGYKGYTRYKKYRKSKSDSKKNSDGAAALGGTALSPPGNKDDCNEKCKPCDPPHSAGTRCYRRDYHENNYNKDIGSPYLHFHIYIRNQQRYPGCKCFWNNDNTYPKAVVSYSFWDDSCSVFRL